MDSTYRGACRGQITKIAKAATEYLNSNESKLRDENLKRLDIIEEELSVLLERMKSAFGNLKKANEEARAALKPDELEKECEKITEYDDTAASTIARLTQRLQKAKELQQLQEQRGDQSSLQHEKAKGTKLPKLQLRRFSGDFKDWLPFWEQYRTAVHENNSLTTIDKFNYLQSLLTGNAADVIAGFTPTETCYDGAIALLLDEFGNTDKIIDKHMQQLISIKSLAARTDVAGLRRLYNSVMSCTRSLTALEVPSTHYFIILKSVLLRCMPTDLRVDFYRCYKEIPQNEDEAIDSSKSSSSTNDLPEGDQQTKALISYLKREVESLEKSYDTSRNQISTVHSKMHKTAAGLFTTASNNNNCVFCKSNHHSTADCDSVLSIVEQKDILKRSGKCFRCTRTGHMSKSCSVRNFCKKCRGKHALPICEPSVRGHNPKNRAAILNTRIDNRSVGATASSSTQPALNLYAGNNSTQPLTDVYLQTACVYAKSPNHSNSLLVRAIFDGGSQISFVREYISRKLKLPVIGTHRISVIPFSCDDQTPIQMCNRVRIMLKSQYRDKIFVLEAVEVPNICLDVLSVPDSESAYFRNFELADTHLHGNLPETGISILIGADQYWKLMSGEVRRLTENLSAIETVFGWTLQGPSPASTTCVNLNFVPTLCLYASSVINEFDLRDFWRLESIGIYQKIAEGVDYTKNLDQFIVKSKAGYVASLPWKEVNYVLEDNREIAINRLYSLVRKLSRQNGRLQEYDNAMRDFIAAGFAEMTEPPNINARLYYMPHRPVYREDKTTTKLRIVFDASAHGPSARSLNDHLSTGSNLLPDLLKIIVNFRLGKIGLIADIEKAFLQILLDVNDRDSHRFFWFKEKVKFSDRLPAIEEFPILQHLASESDEFPETAAILRENFYMDDLVVSTNNEESAITLYKEGSEIMDRASMNLRKWQCNNYVVRTAIGIEDKQFEVQKVLGVPWYIASDELAVDLESVANFLQSIPVGTKRNVLQAISRIYDPLGMLGPCTIRLKILFQTAWRVKLSWDITLPDKLLLIWNNCSKDISALKNLMIPRCVWNEGEPSIIEVHIFSDASLQAYGCAAYLRIVNQAQIFTGLLIAKTRVAPLKEEGKSDLTLPRLELTAALIASRFSMDGLEDCIVLDSRKIEKWQPYIENRVKEIRDLTDTNDWRHCAGSENPADLLTRGITAKQLIESKIWKKGLNWLAKSSDYWPKAEIAVGSLMVETTLNVEVSELSLNASQPLLDLTRYSRWIRVLRVTAFCLRFVDRIRGRFDICQHSKYLTALEIHRAELLWILYIQRLWFRTEIEAVHNKGNLPKTSKISGLKPILDQDGVLRVGSRLQLLDDYQTVYPIILPDDSYLSKLLISDSHERTLHGGVGLVLAQLRERFWILRSRQIINKVLKECRFCRWMRGKNISPPYGPLPLERMMQSKPFETTGIDFAGPLYTKQACLNDVCQKVYIMLFSCATVRAVHLELVQDLTTESCLMGLRRFISRRGVPRYIYSDIARTFKRASKELQVLQEFLNGEKLHDFLSQRKISWRFIVERAPWWGGFWERMVKNVKDVLKAAIKKATLSMDELCTFLMEAEMIVNSRPLTYVANDPLDLEPLTPTNFLLGGPPSSLSPSVQKSSQVSHQDIRAMWTERFKLSNFFWKRWRLEYLQQLRSLYHNKGGFSLNLKEGDVVQVFDPSTTRLFWKLAVVENVYPGRDGKIRACEIPFHNGTKVRRAVQALYPIELS